MPTRSYSLVKGASGDIIFEEPSIWMRTSTQARDAWVSCHLVAGCGSVHIYCEDRQPLGCGPFKRSGRPWLSRPVSPMATASAISATASGVRLVGRPSPTATLAHTVCAFLAVFHLVRWIARELVGHRFRSFSEAILINRQC